MGWGAGGSRTIENAYNSKDLHGFGMWGGRAGGSRTIENALNSKDFHGYGLCCGGREWPQTYRKLLKNLMIFMVWGGGVGAPEID